MGESANDRPGSPRDTRLRVEGLSKTFPGVVALRQIEIDIRPSEVHALVGPNGSGKSTLIKVLSGYQAPDPGAKAWLHGHEVAVSHLSQRASQTAGILAFVHQDLGLILQLNALDNFALRTGFARSRVGRISRREQIRQAESLLEPLGVRLNLHLPLLRATPVERTMVAIAIALQGWDPKTGILVLDEPTASLPYHQVQRLTAVIRRLRSQGAGILYVSHRLDEIFGLADRVTVLRNGYRISTTPVAEITKRELVQKMLGTEFSNDSPADLSETVFTERALEVRNVSGKTVRDVAFSVAQGEVLGIAGLVGSGNDELPRLLSDRCSQAWSGQFRTARDEWELLRRIDSNVVALVPPDRGHEGVLHSMTVLENLTISQLDNLSTGTTWLSKRREREFAAHWVARLGIVTQGLGNRIENLSGGNQQKVIIGRTLSRSPSVLILCEPTAGVDVAARHYLYGLIRAQVNKGLAVIVSSADPDDLIALCDRVIVFRDGQIGASLTAAELTEKRLVEAMEGVDEAETHGAAEALRGAEHRGPPG
jgi:ABC-type sugar transport system ATPase subunit